MTGRIRLHCMACQQAAAAESMCPSAHAPTQKPEAPARQEVLRWWRASAAPPHCPAPPLPPPAPRFPIARPAVVPRLRTPPAAPARPRPPSCRHHPGDCPGPPGRPPCWRPQTRPGGARRGPAAGRPACRPSCGALGSAGGAGWGTAARREAVSAHKRRVWKVKQVYRLQAHKHTAPCRGARPHQTCREPSVGAAVRRCRPDR